MKCYCVASGVEMIESHPDQWTTIWKCTVCGREITETISEE